MSVFRPRPDWWRGQTPSRLRWPSRGQRITGSIDTWDGHELPRESDGLHTVFFDQADLQGLTIELDSAHLSVLFSEFTDCTFTQRERGPTNSEAAAQGSFANRPAIYRRCTFIGVRFRTLAGFDAGQARFEDCVFDQCRFEQFFPHETDFVRCRFIGPIKAAVFFGRTQTGRVNDIEGNDFTHAALSDNVAFRSDFPFSNQMWPEGFHPNVEG
jgi:uncharacterized protein YjbI with pentapeptide repeats